MAKTKDKRTNFSAIVEVDNKGHIQKVQSHLLGMIELAIEQDPNFKDVLLEKLEK